MRAGFDQINFFPFRQYSLIRTHSLDALNDAVSREIGPHDFSCLQRTQAGSSRVTCVRLKKTRLFGVNFGTALKASTPPARDLQLVLPLTGSVVKHGGDQTYKAGSGQGLFILPGTPINVDWSRDCLAAIIWVDSQEFAAMIRAASGETNISAVRFPNLIDLRRGAGLSIANLARTIMLELNDENSLFSRGIISKSIEDNLLLSMLHSAAELPTRTIAGDGNQTLRTALDYIYAHLEDDISILDLTRLTGVSVRKLQYDFTRVYGVGPMTLIRREKLRRIRKELKELGPQDITIAEIAARWSFFDRGYFTRIYKKEFGETPSATLGGGAGSTPRR